MISLRCYNVFKGTGLTWNVYKLKYKTLCRLLFLVVLLLLLFFLVLLVFLVLLLLLLLLSVFLLLMVDDTDLCGMAMFVYSDGLYD